MKKNGNGHANVDKKYPAAVSNEDRLEFILGTERLARIEAQAKNLEVEHTKALQEHQAVKVRLKATYDLGVKDTFNTTTGAIARGGLQAVPTSIKEEKKPEAAPTA